MILNVIYFLIVLILVMVIIYAILQALTFFKIAIPTPIRNIGMALLFLVLLYVFLRYFNLLPPGLGSSRHYWVRFV